MKSIHSTDWALRVMHIWSKLQVHREAGMHPRKNFSTAKAAQLLKGGTMRSRSVKVSPTLFSIKHVVTAGHDYAVIMPLREALTCAGSVVFMQNRFNSVWFLVNIEK